MSRQIRRNQILLISQQTCWVNPVTPTGRDTDECNKEVHTLYQRKGAKLCRERSPLRLQMRQNHLYEKQEDNGDDIGPEEMFRNLPKIPPTTTVDIQTCPLPSSKGFQE